MLIKSSAEFSKISISLDTKGLMKTEACLFLKKGLMFLRETKTHDSASPLSSSPSFMVWRKPHTRYCWSRLHRSISVSSNCVLTRTYSFPRFAEDGEPHDPLNHRKQLVLDVRDVHMLRVRVLTKLPFEDKDEV